MEKLTPPLFTRLWRDVTLNLKLKDIDAATEAKHRLEEKQRAEARERKENEKQWETRVRQPACLLLLHHCYLEMNDWVGVIFGFSGCT